jgi:CheY-like chemotaxis protein
MRKTAQNWPRRHNPDVIFLDSMMPGLSQTDAIRHVRAATPQAKLIYHTHWYRDPIVVQDAVEAGADRVILYGPYFPGDLISVVQEVTGNPPSSID